MAATCRLELPCNVRVATVAAVIGKLLGLDAVKCGIGASSWYCDVPGAKIRLCGPDFPACCRISIRGSKYGYWQCMYHFEGPGGRRAILPDETPLNLAICRRLVEFFGGHLTYNMSSEGESSYFRADKSDAENCPETGNPWLVLQERIFNEPPLDGAI